MTKENEILHGNFCSLCSEKLNFAEKNYTHLLSDGTLCQKCQMSLLQLLGQKKLWIDEDAFRQTMQGSFSVRKVHAMPLEKAQTLLSLRDGVCGRVLETAGLSEGHVFAVQTVFSMPPSPALFILRARKLRNKAVLQGFPLRGEVKKGDRIRLVIHGAVREFEALDVVPAGTERLEKETFFGQLSTNVHKHRVTAAGSGWIILNTEDAQGISEGALAAVCI